jgi:Uma2 family endonuclease
MLRMPSSFGTLEPPEPGKETRMVTVDMPRLPMTAEEFERMPPVRGLRMELWEGNLDVAAAAQMAWHSRIIWQIVNMFADAGRVVTTETGVVIAPRTVRAPDVTRFRPGYHLELRRSQFQPADIDLVAEVVSPESQTRDRVIKPQEYAGAGIPEFWLVEQHPDDEADAMVNIHELSNTGSYRLTRSVSLSDLEKDNLGRVGVAG